MKIVIDARIGFGTGIGRYSFNLIDQLQQLDRENQYVILMLGKDFDKWQPATANFKKVLADYKFYGFKEQLLLPILLWRLRPDLVHFTSFNVPLAYFSPYVVTVHDLTLLKFKNIRGHGFNRLAYQVKYWVMRLVLRHAIMVSRAIITPTQFVRGEVMQKYGHSLTPAPASKVTVTLEGGSEPPASNESLDQLKLDGQFLLYVGNSYPHKNLSRLIEAFSLIRSHHPQFKLILAGQEDYFYRQLREQVYTLDIQSAVVFAGYVTEAEMAALYKSAKLLVYPSLSEGFGLQPLESMAYGTPVIASSVSSIPEVCGDAVAYFDPTDTADMAARISSLLDSPKELERLNQTGLERVKQFSWRRMAEQTLRVYQATIKK